MRQWHRVVVAGLGVVALALAAALVLTASGGQDSLAAGATIYVDADATSGGDDGSSWGDAFIELQPALDAAASGDEIWVATGTYKPTAEHGGSGERFRSFQMMNGVALYGGFDPSVGDVAFEDRDWEMNLTILSGDLGSEGDNSDNSYHVFYNPSGLDSTAILDGLTITGGNANGDDPHSSGGGMYNQGSSPTVTNCTFVGNSARRGGGMYNETSSPTVTNCTFADNSGSGMHNRATSSPTLTNCTFEGNYAGSGGGMYNRDSSPALTNCTFEGNSAMNGGGIHNDVGSSPTLTNCTFSNNSADGNGGGGMTNYEGSSPTLTGCTFLGNSAMNGGGIHNEADSSPTLADCTFEGNSANYEGGGMYNSAASSPTVTNCTFSNNLAGWGGGMANRNGSSPTVMNCTFEDNSASEAGGMYNYEYSLPTLTDCTFVSNSADHGGGMSNSWYSSPILLNCAFAGNSADYGGGLNNSYSSPTLTNCTFIGNSAESDGGAIYSNTHGTVLTNCILWGDTPNEIAGGWSAVTYSDIQGGYDGQGNMDVDPLFVDPVNTNFHLRADSPCIDAGSNSAPGLPAHDFEGNDRVLDGDGDGTATVDMGVDEARWPLFVDADATSGANNGSSWQDAFTALQPALDVAVTGDQILVGAGTYTPNVEYGGTGERYKSFQLINGVALFGGFDPSVGDTAFEDRDWDANATILSGDLNGDDGPDFESNDENSYHVFFHPEGTNLDSRAVLDGFTLSGGNADLNENFHWYGAGMLNFGSSPALANCTFTDNWADYGGGMANLSSSSPALANCTFADNSANTGGGMTNSTSSSPTLVDCSFRNNTASSRGGGMHNTDGSSPTLLNCTFQGNSAASWGGGGMFNQDSAPTLINCILAANSGNEGGGVYNWSASPTLTNCTFRGNSATAGGGMYSLLDSSPVLTNCILWGDTPEEIFNNDPESLPVITYSDIQGGDPGTGNIDADPLFVDPDNGDFHLGLDSPCIDVGNNDAPDLPDIDFEGNGRVVDGDGDGIAIVDMGVDEVPIRVYLPLVLRGY